LVVKPNDAEGLAEAVVRLYGDRKLAAELGWNGREYEMNILIVTHYNFGNKSSGASNRVLELAKALSNYASIKILHRGPDMVSDSLEFIGYKSIFFSVTNWISDAVSPYVSPAFPDFYGVAKSLVANADVIQVEQPYLLIPTLILIKTLSKDPIIALDAHNVDFVSVKSKLASVYPSSILTAMTLPYVFLSERFSVKNADIVLCVSQKDRELFMKFYRVPKSKLFVIPNGVNFEKFEKAMPINDASVKNNRTVFFHGTLSWYPNLEAANIIVDYLAPKIPEATFLIAGANPSLTLIKKIEKTRNVKYLGYVESLEAWIKASDMCMAPILRGGGTKLKVLEYAAAGKPIVATYKAVQGLDMINGVHGLFRSDVDEGFVKWIRLLLKDDRFAQKFGRNAKQLAEKYDWRVIGRELYEIYLNFVS